MHLYTLYACNLTFAERGFSATAQRLVKLITIICQQRVYSGLKKLGIHKLHFSNA